MLNLAIIGCGLIGNRVSRSFEKFELVNIKYAVDTNNERLQDFCTKFNATGFDSYDDLLEQNDFDIVYIGVPPKFHSDIAISALNHGRHVICEKPIADNSTAGQKMVDTAKSTSLVVGINFVFNFMESFQTMKSLVHKGELGDIEDITIQIHLPTWPRQWQNVEWLKDHDQGGPLREIGSHFIYALHDIFGSVDVLESEFELTEPGKYEKLVKAKLNINGYSGLLDIQIGVGEEDVNTLYITGSEKKIRFRNWYILEELQDEQWIVIDDTSGDVSLKLLEEFYKEISTKDGNLVSFETANDVQIVIDKIFVLI